MPRPAVALAAALLLAGPAIVIRAQQAPAKATPEQWQTALKAVREIAFDPNAPVQHRANAVMAYAKLQALRGQYDDAVKTCWEALQAATQAELATAAAGAACFVSRRQFGHIDAPDQLAKAWQAKAPGGPARGALAKARQDFVKIRQYLMGIAAKKMPPGPVATKFPDWAVVVPKSGVRAVNFRPPGVSMPGWMVVQKERGPSALQVALPQIPVAPLLARDAKTGIPRGLNLALPVYTAPPWYGRVQFPLLKEPKE